MHSYLELQTANSNGQALTSARVDVGIVEEDHIPGAADGRPVG